MVLTHQPLKKGQGTSVQFWPRPQGQQGMAELIEMVQYAVNTISMSIRESIFSHSPFEFKCQMSIAWLIYHAVRFCHCCPAFSADFIWVTIMSVLCSVKVHAHICALHLFPILFSTADSFFLTLRITGRSNGNGVDIPVSVRGHNFRPPFPEYSRAPSPEYSRVPSPEYSCAPTPSTLCQCKTPYIIPYRQRPHSPTPSPSPSQSSFTS